MRNDEFNTVKVNNEKQISRKEFGKIPRNEYHSKNDNVFFAEKNNQINLKNDKVDENKLKFEHKKQINIQNTAKATQSVASVAGQTVVAASIIAVGVVSTSAKINIIPNEDLLLKVEYISFSENNIIYNFILENCLDYNYIIVLENDNYYKSYELIEGHNEGIFENLEFGQRYNLYIKDDNEFSNKVFDRYFTMEQHNEFYYFYIDPFVDIEMQTFNVYLEYIDYGEAFDNFKIYFEDIEDPNINYTIDLDNTSGRQECPLVIEPDVSFLELYRTYNFIFSYYEDGNYVEYDSGQITFETSNYSVFNNFTFDKTADFYNRTFDVSLDFDDINNQFDDFRLYLEDTNSEVSYMYSLDKTTSIQTLDASLSDEDLYFDLEEGNFYYEFRYFDNGQEVLYDSGSFTFTNISTYSEFFGFNFDQTADFENNCFDVSLNFVDYGDRFDNFTLVLTDSAYPDVSQTFILDKTRETQTLYVSAEESTGGPLLDLIHSSFEYLFTYTDNGETIEYDSGLASFENSIVSVFNNLDCDFVISNSSYQMPLRLDYDNAAGTMSNPTMVLIGQDSSETEYELSETNQWQYFDIGGSDMINFFVDQTFTVEIRFDYYNIKDESSVRKAYYSEQKTFTQGNISKIFGMSVDRQDIVDDSMFVTLYYFDENSYYSDFTFIVTTDDGEVYRFEYEPIPGEYDGRVSIMDSLNENYSLEDFKEKLSLPVDIAISYVDSSTSEQEYVEMLYDIQFITF